MKKDFDKNEGKRIRKAYLESAWIGDIIVLLMGVVFCILMSICEESPSYEAYICVALGLLLLAGNALAQFVFGRPCVILGHDRMYFRNARITRNNRTVEGGGYIYYRAIRNIDVCKVRVSHKDKVYAWKIAGSDFEIVVLGPSRLGRKCLYNAMNEAGGYTYFEQGYEIIYDSYGNKLPEKNGLYGELWTAFELGELDRLFADFEIEDIFNYDCFVEIRLKRGSDCYTVNFDNESLYMLYENEQEDSEKEVPLGEISDMDSFKRLVNDFIN